ncbi:hypothetical protein HK407_03g06230 [Ordospora pajunii]|uniref:uncharacterized protein n=1 Tax=Ordospora pajunii TaxID=3039483 RepID=UPI0029528044|nr:uncharacterized protein HK407_03g06230 [Ordospora pajunii]KAH9411871.1 hypothetical protein HK407_03g06230 [Ordospora pajunii]
MNRIDVMKVLGIPLEIVFDGCIGEDVQSNVIDLIEKRTFFRVKQRDVSMDSLIFEALKDVSFSMCDLRYWIGKCLFDQEIEFMESVNVMVCDKMPTSAVKNRYCICINEISSADDLEIVFQRVIEFEIEKRLDVSEKGWSLGTFSNIFRNDPARDKRVGDGLFLAQRYKEAYKVYSRYGKGEFGYYCTQMSIYCLVLSNKPVPKEILERFHCAGEKLDVYLIRLVCAVIDVQSGRLAIRIVPSLTCGSLFKAFAQECLNKVLDGNGYARKRAAIAYDCAVLFLKAGLAERAISCASVFLGMTDMMLCKEDCGAITKDILVFAQSYIRSIAGIKSKALLHKGALDEYLQYTNSRDYLYKTSINRIRNVVKLFRAYEGSISKFEGKLNTKESLLIESKIRCIARILNGNGVESICEGNGEIALGKLGKYIIKDMILKTNGVDRIVQIEELIDVDEEVKFMHVCMESIYEMYCGEVRQVTCRVIRNYDSEIVISFCGMEFITSSNEFIFDMMFPCVGYFDEEVAIESDGIRAWRSIRFNVIPSFSISFLHYKYCFPLLFIRVLNHTREDARLAKVSSMNNRFEVFGMSVGTLSFSREEAIKYFKKNILGVNGNYTEANELKSISTKPSGSVQDILGSMSKSPPVISDLFFQDMVSAASEEISLDAKTNSIFAFVKQCNSMNGSILNLNEEAQENSQMCGSLQIDRVLVRNARFMMVSKYIGEHPSISLDSITPYELPIKIEISVSSERRCVFVPGCVLTELALGALDIRNTCLGNAQAPFVYITHSAPIGLNEPAIIYLCVSNYYQNSKLMVSILPKHVIVCNEDRSHCVGEMSFSFFEIRCMLLRRGRYNADDMGVTVHTDDEQIEFECEADVAVV